ncbi:MAG: hypothetical protein J0M12_08715 [Deltaproteobacteria bacterium]|nr:hypothetical protein [Deltaproteobacteria bacterium]
MAITKPKLDKRLIGTWRSDRALTLKWWTFPPNVTPAKRARFGRLFGKLTFRITKDRIYGTFDDSKWTNTYVILAADSDSVVLGITPITREGKKLIGKERESKIWYIRFHSKDCFCIFAPGNLEYFRKLKVYR